MKIAIADNCNGKFTSDLKEHWEKEGHEVRLETGASEELAQWADIYYVDFWDNNIHYLYKLYHGVEGVSRTPDWDNNKKPLIVVRAIDWEVWCGLMRDQAIIDWVDKIIFIAPHIQQKVASEVKLNGKDKLIRPGVNLEKFTLKTKKTDGFQLGMVLGDMWWPKNHMAGLDIFTTLYKENPKWRLHIRGQHEGGNDFWKAMFEYYLESRGIKDVVTLYPKVENMNEWYENIDILLHPGMKEAFSYAVGEAMAKGIPAVVNDFQGSQDIWQLPFGPDIYQTHPEAIEKIKKRKLDSGFNRRFIKDNYSLNTMVKEIDEYVGI